MLEDPLHEAVMEYLRLVLSAAVVVHHAPMEGKRGWKAQRQLKKYGAKKGWPDIELVYCGRIFFIELKAAKGRVSSAQDECHADLRNAGAPVAVCRTVDEVAAALRAFGIPTRER